MDSQQRTTGYRLYENAALVGFSQEDVVVQVRPDNAEFAVRVKLSLGFGEEEGEDPAELAKWAGWASCSRLRPFHSPTIGQGGTREGVHRRR